jgi:hypothetical protein
MEKIYTDKKISENTLERTFYKETPQDGLVWHRDKEDRIITCEFPTDWKIQLDNELPKVIDKNFIPKNTFHRLIKGSDGLTIKIEKKIDKYGPK